MDFANAVSWWRTVFLSAMICRETPRTCDYGRLNQHSVTDTIIRPKHVRSVLVDDEWLLNVDDWLAASNVAWTSPGDSSVLRDALLWPAYVCLSVPCVRLSVWWQLTVLQCNYVTDGRTTSRPTNRRSNAAIIPATAGPAVCALILHELRNAIVRAYNRLLILREANLFLSVSRQTYGDYWLFVICAVLCFQLQCRSDIVYKLKSFFCQPLIKLVCRLLRMYCD